MFILNMDMDKVQVNLFDPEENKIYPIFISHADCKRCETGKTKVSFYLH